MFATGRQRRGAPDAMLLLLLAQLYSTIERLPIKPPVTLGLAAANVLAHVRPDLTPPLARMCLAPSRVLAALRRGHGDFNGEVPLRLLGSAFVHADDFHLYYNMASLLWKGCSLEQRLGPQLFLELTVVVLALSSVLAVALNCAFDRAGLHMLGSINSCHVGFSGVLFAYKYILNHDAPGAARGDGVSRALRSRAVSPSSCTSFVVRRGVPRVRRQAPASAREPYPNSYLFPGERTSTSARGLSREAHNARALSPLAPAGETRVHHIFRVATRHATWLELALISALSPRASR